MGLRELLMVVSLFAAGCAADSADGDQAGESAPPSALPDRSELASLTLPLGYLFDQNQADRTTLDRAVDLLAERCMADLGFPYPGYPQQPYDPAIGPVRRYLYLSVEEAETFGYHSPRAAEFAHYNAEEARIDASMPSSPEFSEALWGKPITGEDGVGAGMTPGCRSRANEQIYGTPQRPMASADFAPILQMQIESSDELYASEGGRAAVGDWVTCMTAAGYTVEEPWTVRSQWGGWTLDDTSAPADDERATAVADATCRAEVNLEVRLFTIEAAIQERMIDAQPDLIATARAEVATAVDRALAAIEAG